MDVGEILDVLGNETRRRILRLLCEGPRYLIQLSRELNVSQQAILKHLAILEKYGFISSYEERGELPAPPRKYYVLNRSIMLTVSLAPHLAQFEAQEVPDQPEIPASLRRFRRQLLRLEACRDREEFQNLTRQLIDEIDGELRKIEEFRVCLLALKRLMAEKLKLEAKLSTIKPCQS
ncbi:MAG: ArsR/SmtB family transcription factor [Candidatus Hecatellaceae archaeon]